MRSIARTCFCGLAAAVLAFSAAKATPNDRPDNPAEPGNKPATESVSIRAIPFPTLGKTLYEQEFAEHRSQPESYHTVIIHESELDGLEAAKDLCSGKVLYLTGTHDRYLHVASGRTHIPVDPNNALTPHGIHLYLGRHYGTKASRLLLPKREEIDDACAPLAAALDTLLLDGTPILSLHQNHRGGFGIKSYKNEPLHAAYAAQVSINPRENPDDFAYVDTRPLFDAFVAHGINTVLQDNSTAKDNGSLSYLAGRKDIPYVNLETELGKTKRHRRLIQVFLQIIEESPYVLHARPHDRIEPLPLRPLPPPSLPPHATDPIARILFEAGYENHP